MTMERIKRERLMNLVESCRTISDYAEEADLPEVNQLLSRLLFALTDGQYGDAGGEAPDAARRANEAMAAALRDQFRAFNRVIE